MTILEYVMCPVYPEGICRFCKHGSQLANTPLGVICMYVCIARFQLDSQILTR